MQIFDEKFEIMQKLTDETNFSGLSGIATDLITTSIMFKYRDGVFIGEVFEAVFDQIDDLCHDFKVEENERNKVKKSIKECIKAISESFRKTDKNDLYEALLTLRFVVTELQYTCFTTMKRKRRLSRPIIGEM